MDQSKDQDRPVIYDIISGEDVFDKAIESLKGDKRLIIGEKAEKEKLIQQYVKENTEAIIRNSYKIDVEDWFEEQKKELEEENREYDEIMTKIIGEWEGAIEIKNEFVLDKEIIGDKRLEKVEVAYVEVKESWHIPAIFQYGGWNGCPLPDVQCAVWKYWQEKYDAHIVGLASDTIEAAVNSPPINKEQALELAWQQFLFCDEIVSQWTESVNSLAGILLNSDKWYFWWD